MLDAKDDEFVNRGTHANLETGLAVTESAAVEAWRSSVPSVNLQAWRQMHYSLTILPKVACILASPNRLIIFNYRHVVVGPILPIPYIPLRSLYVPAMEKYSQFRDRGSGIAPFFPISTPSSYLSLPFHTFLFLIRLPILLSFSLSYFLFLQWLPIGPLGRKASLWLILGTPGVWWIDLQIDGVRKGYFSPIPPNTSPSLEKTPDPPDTQTPCNSSLAKHHLPRLPHPSSIIACSFTSPLDALYLAAIFDPIFTASYPSTPLVQHISPLHAILRAFSPPQPYPPRNISLVPLSTLLKRYPNQPIVVFPECSTTNGRGILPFSPSLLSVGGGGGGGGRAATKVFPISLRYTAPDVTTPVPHTYVRLLWNLLSKPTHCIRVRIAESVVVQSPRVSSGGGGMHDDGGREERASSSDTLLGSEEGGESMTASERRFLDRVAEALARLGRVKRVGLGVVEKERFVRAWRKEKGWWG